MSGILLVRYFLTGNKEVDANSQASRRMQHIDVWAQLWLFSDKLCSTFHLWNSMLLMPYFPTGKRKLMLKVPPVDEYWNTACEMFFDQDKGRLHYKFRQLTNARCNWVGTRFSANPLFTPEDDKGLICVFRNRRGNPQ